MRVTFCPWLRSWVLAGAGLAQYGDISDLKLLKEEDKVDVKSTPAPQGATVLFDGKNLDQWVSRKDGKSAGWTLTTGGAMQVKGGDIHTKEKYDGKFKLHVEFRVPYLPKKSGQGRGQQRRVFARPLRGAGAGQLRSEEQGQRLRRHLHRGGPAGERLQGADGVAELRH